MDVRRWPHRGRPQGQPTRGKTTQNRLRRVDLFLAWYAPDLLRRHDGAFAHAWLVDLGYGAEPFTTLEMAQRLRRLNPRLPVLGVEIDPERVAAALPYADDLTHFRRGGFNLPLTPRPDGTPETVRAIRAFNVLRQYDEAAVAAAYAELAHGVLPGGLLVEGTSDPLGRHWVANVLRRAADAPAWQPEALVFSTNFRGGWEPALFQAVLPKNLIHRMTPGEPIWALLAAWKAAAQRSSAARAWGLRAWFVAAAERLAAEGWPVRTRGRWARAGFLVVEMTRQWPKTNN
jgi:hypothetical protein